MTQPALILRQIFHEGDEIRDRGLSAPQDVTAYRDIVYGKTDRKFQSLDLYLPKAQSNKLPVIVSVHGGGLVYGDKERYQYYCMELARYGFAVVNFSYRLAPEYQFPSPFEDTNMVFEWLFENAEKYNLDPGQLFAVGDSAGAFILSIYAGCSVNPAYASLFDFELPKELNFRAVGLICGNYHTDVSQKGLVIPTPLGEVTNQDLMFSFHYRKLSPGFFDDKQW